MIARLLAKAGYRKSSPQVSSLAARLLRQEMPPLEQFQEMPALMRDAYAELLGDAKRLAGSVLSQDETKGQD